MAMNQRFCNGMIHVIKKGDNLYQLSRMYRIPLALILRANPYVDVYNLQPGQEICIPMSRSFRGRGSSPGQRPADGGREEDQTAVREDSMDGSMNNSVNNSLNNNSMDSDNNDMAERARQEQIEDAIEEARANSQDEQEESADRGEDYCCDGTKSLGQILEESQCELSEFLEQNDLGHIIIAADVVIHLPKKV